MNVNEKQVANVVHNPPSQTAGFVFNHTMLRVKDPAASLAFYTSVMGMALVCKEDYLNDKFSLYFLSQLQPDTQLPKDKEARKQWLSQQRGILELTHNWGTETQADFHYHDGNQQPQGFGHICFSVPDLAAAIAFFDTNNVTYQKRPEDGRMKNIAFIKDPDGYWVEIIQG